MSNDHMCVRAHLQVTAYSSGGMKWSVGVSVQSGVSQQAQQAYSAGAGWAGVLPVDWACSIPGLLGQRPASCTQALK